MLRLRFDPGSGSSLGDRFPWRGRLLTPIFLGFPGGSDGKAFAYNVGDLGLIPGLRRSPGRGHGNPLHFTCLENPHGQRSLVGYSSWGRKESDMTEQLSTMLRLGKDIRIHLIISLSFLTRIYCISKSHRIF